MTHTMMTSLLEVLQQSVPGLEANAAVDFRSCVVAIALQLQDEDQQQARLERSLGDWWQWLDEEGYSRDGFAAVLQQLCQASLGTAAQQELMAEMQAMAGDSAGLPALMEHLQANHPDFAERLQSLEELAIKEEMEIQKTAGGMGKVGKGLVLTSAVVVGTVLGVGLTSRGYKGIRKWLINREAQRFSAAEQTARQDKERLLSAIKDNKAQIEKDLISLAEKPDTRVAREARELASKYQAAHGYIDMDKAINHELEQIVTASDSRFKEHKLRLAKKILVGDKGGSLTADERVLFDQYKTTKSYARLSKATDTYAFSELQKDFATNPDFLAFAKKELRKEVARQLLRDMPDIVISGSIADEEALVQGDLADWRANGLSKGELEGLGGYLMKVGRSGADAEGKSLYNYLTKEGQQIVGMIEDGIDFKQIAQDAEGRAEGFVQEEVRFMEAQLIEDFIPSTVSKAADQVVKEEVRLEQAASQDLKNLEGDLINAADNQIIQIETEAAAVEKGIIRNL